MSARPASSFVHNCAPRVSFRCVFFYAKDHIVSSLKDQSTIESQRALGMPHDRRLEHGVYTPHTGRLNVDFGATCDEPLGVVHIRDQREGLDPEVGSISPEDAVRDGCVFVAFVVFKFAFIDNSSWSYMGMYRETHTHTHTGQRRWKRVIRDGDQRPLRDVVYQGASRTLNRSLSSVIGHHCANPHQSYKVRPYWHWQVIEAGGKPGRLSCTPASLL
ncbi:hypothetical protein F5I97DRAFT_977630 [Phlebopus sp. FC_14]|nr:hypothetical protein F5I97DRAFT_977630 [Phlebopus sp. FC_14]